MSNGHVCKIQTYTATRNWCRKTDVIAEGGVTT